MQLNTKTSVSIIERLLIKRSYLDFNLKFIQWPDVFDQHRNHKLCIGILKHKDEESINRVRSHQDQKLLNSTFKDCSKIFEGWNW